MTPRAAASPLKKARVPPGLLLAAGAAEAPSRGVVLMCTYDERMNKKPSTAAEPPKEKGQVPQPFPSGWPTSVQFSQPTHWVQAFFQRQGHLQPERSYLLADG